MIGYPQLGTEAYMTVLLLLPDQFYAARQPLGWQADAGGCEADTTFTIVGHLQFRCTCALIERAAGQLTGC